MRSKNFAFPGFHGNCVIVLSGTWRIIPLVGAVSAGNEVPYVKQAATCLEANMDRGRAVAAKARGGLCMIVIRKQWPL